MPVQYTQEPTLNSESESPLNRTEEIDNKVSQSLGGNFDQNEVNSSCVIEESKNVAMKKPNLRIFTQIDDNFQIQSGENTGIENSTDDGQNFQYDSTYDACKEDDKDKKSQQVLIED